MSVSKLPTNDRFRRIVLIISQKLAENNKLSFDFQHTYINFAYMEVTHKQEYAEFANGHPAIMHMPQIAIIGSNTLMSIGLRSIIEKMMPGIAISLLSNMNELKQQENTNFIHYFISSEVLMENSAYFLERKHQTIVLVHGNECLHFPENLHTLNICLPAYHNNKSFLLLLD